MDPLLPEEKPPIFRHPHSADVFSGSKRTAAEQLELLEFIAVDLRRIIRNLDQAFHSTKEVWSRDSRAPPIPGLDDQDDSDGAKRPASANDDVEVIRRSDGLAKKMTDLLVYLEPNGELYDFKTIVIGERVEEWEAMDKGLEHVEELHGRRVEQELRKNGESAAEALAQSLAKCRESWPRAELASLVAANMAAGKDGPPLEAADVRAIDRRAEQDRWEKAKAHDHAACATAKKELVSLGRRLNGLMAEWSGTGGPDVSIAEQTGPTWEDLMKDAEDILSAFE
ncbi:unnamed protein product [Discula destructiva]